MFFLYKSMSLFQSSCAKPVPSYWVHSQSQLIQSTGTCSNDKSPFIAAVSSQPNKPNSTLKDQAGFLKGNKVCLIKGSAQAMQECSLHGILAPFWPFNFTFQHRTEDRIRQQYPRIKMRSSRWASVGCKWWKLLYLVKPPLWLGTHKYFVTCLLVWLFSNVR